MKRLLSILLTLVICFVLLSPSSVDAATIKLNKTNLILNEGNTYQLKVSGTTKTIKWASSNKSIATVSSKGKITAVKAGTATITATVATKKLTCSLTVKESFNAKKALENMTSDITDTGEGLIVVLENKYQYDCKVDITVVYYDDGGDMIGKSSSDNYYFVRGTKCALNFSGPYDADYKHVPYADYKINYSIEKTADYYKSNVGDIIINSNYGADNVMVEATNNGDKSPDYTLVSIVFYKNGNAIAYDYTYADVKSPGKTDYLKFTFPYDDNYDAIQPDDYQVFVNYSYYSNY